MQVDIDVVPDPDGPRQVRRVSRITCLCGLDARQMEPRALLHEEAGQDDTHVMYMISDGEDLAQGTDVVDHKIAIVECFPPHQQ